MNIAFYILDGKPFLSNPQYRSIFNELLKNGLDQQIILTMYYVERQNQSNYVLYDEFAEIIKSLQAANKRVVLVGDVPRYSIDASLCVYRNSLSQVYKSCSISKNDAVLQKNLYSIILETLAANFNVPYIDLYAPLCFSDSCSMVNGDTILYRDNNHLNIPGSRLIGSHLARKLWP